MNYPIITSTHKLSDGRVIRVIRDDMIPGGTKQRILTQLVEPDIEYVYASPTFGFAQVALAAACSERYAKATIFVAQRPTSGLHIRTVIAESYGAKVIQVPSGMQNVITAHAERYVKRTKNAVMFPLGFDYPAFDAGLDKVLARMRTKPKQVFCAVGTGTLYRGLRRKWPNAEFHVVRAGMMPHCNLSDVTLHTAPERYEQNAKIPPPFPSCSNVDAKIWRFVLECAIDGALVWNVAS